FFAIIRFRDINGKLRTLIQPLAELDDLKALEKTLKNAGCRFSARQNKNYSALKKLSSSAGKAQRWKFARSNGWYEQKTFVYPNGIMGRQTKDPLVKPPRLNQYGAALKISGSHQRWANTVAHPARFSSRMVFGICMALGAPLLKFAE